MSKNIALFFDGTWMRREARGESNVYRLYKMAEEVALEKQISLYISGVGTERMRYKEVNELRRRARIDDESIGKLAKLTRKCLGGMAGFGIGTKIKEAYAFLVDHYNQAENDRVYVFGFSRGAFAARSLAAFIDDVGMLLRDRLYLVPEAYEIYRSGEGRDLLKKYLEDRLGHRVILGERPIRVYLIGVWDTVSALGLPAPFQDISFNTDHLKIRQIPRNVTHARHALALHELRTLYPPATWAEPLSHQDLQQVWFAGAHADVGGSYPEIGLSDLSLMWMADQAKALHLILDEVRVKIAPNPHEIVHQELGFPHSAFKYVHRQALSDLVDGRADERDVATHAIHPSALIRILQPQPYKFKAAMNAQMREVDRLTLRLAVKQAFLAQAFPPMGDALLVKLSRKRLEESLANFDPDDKVSMAQLTSAIALGVLSEGLKSMEFIQQTSCQWIDDVHAEMIHNPANAILLQHQVLHKLNGLVKIAENIPAGMAKRHLKPLAACQELAFKIQLNHPG